MKQNTNKKDVAEHPIRASICIIIAIIIFSIIYYRNVTPKYEQAPEIKMSDDYKLSS